MCPKIRWIAIHEQPGSWQIANRNSEVKKLADQFARVQPELIVLEASGGYEMLSVSILGLAGLVITTVGIVMLVRFLEAYPAAEHEEN
jgi:hypothetical protein